MYPSHDTLWNHIDTAFKYILNIYTTNIDQGYPRIHATWPTCPNWLDLSELTINLMLAVVVDKFPSKTQQQRVEWQVSPSKTRFNPIRPMKEAKFDEISTLFDNISIGFGEILSNLHPFLPLPTVISLNLCHFQPLRWWSIHSLPVGGLISSIHHFFPINDKLSFPPLD